MGPYRRDEGLRPAAQRGHVLHHRQEHHPTDPRGGCQPGLRHHCLLGGRDRRGAVQLHLRGVRARRARSLLAELPSAPDEAASGPGCRRLHLRQHLPRLRLPAGLGGALGGVEPDAQQGDRADKHHLGLHGRGGRHERHPARWLLLDSGGARRSQHETCRERDCVLLGAQGLLPPEAVRPCVGGLQGNAGPEAEILRGDLQHDHRRVRPMPGGQPHPPAPEGDGGAGHPAQPHHVQHDSQRPLPGESA
mmetsp:Transcript_48774/g.153323  ORF Transcript_48774/g.153323 Transcript_48774/m.153323 type:complete len:248 (+) Transcript_48774:421-1164(+)